MLRTDPLRWLLLALALTSVGCETDKDGVNVNFTAALRAHQAQLDRQPGRAEVERMVAHLSPEQLNDLGVLYEREGRLEEAEWAYQRAVWRDPRFAPGYVNLGNVLRKRGRTEQALLRYRQAMSADPDSFEAVNNFGDLCAEQGIHLDEAIARLTPLTPRPGRHRAYGLDTLGWLYHVRGDEPRAAETLEAALSETGEDTPALRLTVHEHLGCVYGALGRQAEAAEQVAQAARLRALLHRTEPGDDDTEEQRERR